LCHDDPVDSIMKRKKNQNFQVDAAELEEILQRAESRNLSEQDYKTVVAIIKAYVQVYALLQKSKVSISRLKKMIFGSKTEKTSSVVGNKADGSSPSQDESSLDTPDSNDDTASDDKPEPDGSPPDSDDKPCKPLAKGHGRNGAAAYSGAEKTDVPHESLKVGDPCPHCQDGSRLYEVTESGVFVQIIGQAPLGGTVHSLQKFRCDLCGTVFTAKMPEGVGPEKYDATAAAMISVLKYGTGMPFNRLDNMQENLGIPVPSSTQWDIVEGMHDKIVPVFQTLVWTASQGDVLYNDDTTVKILELMGKRSEQTLLAGESLDIEGVGEDRTGLYTTGVVSTVDEGHQIGLFFSSRKLAGENLKDVLSQRAEELGPPIQMCDGLLSHNLPGELKTILANCMCHSRRKFVEVYDIFQEECRHVLEALKVIYKNDTIARKQELSPEERLRFHQAESGPIMEELHDWLNRQFDQRLVEPNSGLGESINYMLNHWKGLTLFLRQAGAPLDNNICERLLKKAILHRRNSLFYRSRKGAQVGDALMSLIYTCQLNRVNPFDYLTELYRNAKDVAKHPERWLPWNYHETLLAGVETA
jgi:transposase